MMKSIVVAFMDGFVEGTIEAICICGGIALAYTGFKKAMKL